MKKMKKSFLSLGMAVMVTAAVTACQSTPKEETVRAETNRGETTAGKEALLSDMSEYIPADGSFSIYLESGWDIEDVGVDNWVFAGNKKGDQVAAIMQYPKSMYAFGNINELEASIDDSMKVSDKIETEAPLIADLSNIYAYTSNVVSGGVKGEGYIVYGESDYAYYSFVMMTQKNLDKSLESFKVSSESFVEIGPEDNSTVELTDTIRWFNASYAVLTKLNNQDINKFGAMAANEANAEITRTTLSEWWGVTDRASAEETIEWIMTEGHRIDFADTMAELSEIFANVTAEERAGAMMNHYTVSKTNAEYYAEMYAYYEEFGANAIDGWDYSRAMSLLGWYYVAGYYTEEEALDKSLEIAGIMQETFTSWDELTDSYLRGYEYWSEESAEERRGIYEGLRVQDNSPYNMDWNLTLEKTW